MKRLATAIAAIALIGTPALAADMAVRAPPRAAVAYSNDGFYGWLDGSWQSVNLPSFALGWKTSVFLGPDVPPSQGYQPRPTGAGVSGAIGYILPYWTVPTVFGSNARIEIGASYVNASSQEARPR